MSGENTSNRKTKQEMISQYELAEQQETHHDKERQQTKEEAQARRAPETSEQYDCHLKKLSRISRIQSPTKQSLYMKCCVHRSFQLNVVITSVISIHI